MKTITLKSAREYRQQTQAVVSEYCQSVTPAARGSKYLGMLQQNTARLQGSLVLVGYDLQGGENQQMIERAALAIELMHAYKQCMEQGIDETQALRAQHEAQIILANLEAHEENRLKALSITNRTLMLATLARLPETSEEDRLRYRATELTLNPLHVGQVLADADCHATNVVTQLATAFGRSLLTDKKLDFDSFLAALATDEF